MKTLDFVALAAAVALVVGVSAVVYGGGAQRATVHVTAPDVEFLFDTTVTEQISVTGPIGETVISISDGGARVVSSPCTNQICVRTGHVSRSGRWIACLPNRLFVSIEADHRHDVDARSF